MDRVKVFSAGTDQWGSEEEEEEEDVVLVSGLYGWMGVLAVMNGVPSMGLPISGQSAQYGGGGCMADAGEEQGRRGQ